MDLSEHALKLRQQAPDVPAALAHVVDDNLIFTQPPQIVGLAQADNTGEDKVDYRSYRKLVLNTYAIAAMVPRERELCAR